MKKLVLSLTLLALFVCGVFIISGYYFLTGPTGGNHEISFEVKAGDTFSSITESLKTKKLIRNELGYKVMLKIKKASSLQSGIYTLNTNMSASKLIDVLSKNPSHKVVRITFKEGRNMRYIVNNITAKMDITEDQIYQKLKDSAYLKTLKDKYWFITNDILNENIYYSLEGYLYPDTYEFVSNAKIEDVFEKMLDNTGKKLAPYKEQMQNSSYTIHQIMTMASMVELEAMTEQDRMGVAGVFYNRLQAKMSLGSDVTTYYAAKVDMGERDLYKSELNASNAYNTRNTNMAGKLPVGPICNPSNTSIKAALNPTVSSYYYFVADKNKKVYFTKNNAEHNQMINRLKKEGLWFTY